MGVAIGKEEEETIVVEPLEDPVPRREPEPAPAPAPEREREPVPPSEVSNRPVAWASFLRYVDSDNAKFSRDWLLTPSNVTTAFRDGSLYCRFCDAYFSEQPAVHVAVHAEELGAYFTLRLAGAAERSRSAVERQERQQRTHELHAQGMSLRKIGEQLGISARQAGRDLDEKA